MRCLSEARAGWGHRLAGRPHPGSKHSLLFTGRAILNKFVYGHSQQFLNPTFHLMLLCVSCCTFVFIHLFLIHLIPEEV